MSNVLTSNRSVPAPLPQTAAKVPEYFVLNERKRPMLDHSYDPVGQIDIYIAIDPTLHRRRPIQMSIDAWYKPLLRSKRLMRKMGYSFKTRNSLIRHEFIECPRNREEYAISLQLAKDWITEHNALLAAEGVTVGHYSEVKDALYQLGLKE